MTVMRVLARYFVECPTIRMLEVFLMMRLRLWIQRGKTTGVKCSFHHIRSRPLTVTVPCDHWHWPCLPGQGEFVRFLHCRVTVSPFHTLYFGKTSLSTYRVGNCSPLRIAEGLHKLVGILLHGRDVSSSHLFVYLVIISIWTQGYWFFTFI